MVNTKPTMDIPEERVESAYTKYNLLPNGDNMELVIITDTFI